jgi:3-methyladenine DNA glycosylase/8-oxoguanine DNA glycosylase
MDDHEILSEVTAVRGIGPWTAHMYLMHTMARRDVWPAGDYGVRSGWSIVHDLDEIISERDLALEGDRFTGVRSAVAWYCWQAVHFARAN